MISNNGNGVREFFSIVLLSNCIITGNTGYGVQGSGGLIYSSKNNTVFGNGTDVSATITPVIPI
jgi:hypothetical protein